MLVFISELHRIVFFVSPKAGYATTRMTFFRLPGQVHEKILIRTCASAHAVTDLDTYTWILVYRDPIQRLVSSFFMPEVADDVTFREFVTNMHAYTGIHQSLQSTGPAMKILERYPHKKFDRAIETRELSKLPEMLNTILKTPYRHPPIHEHKRSIESTDDACVADTTKGSFSRDKLPRNAQFFDAPLRELANERVAPDYAFFEKYEVRL